MPPPPNPEGVPLWHLELDEEEDGMPALYKSPLKKRLGVSKSSHNRSGSSFLASKMVKSQSQSLSQSQSQVEERPDPMDESDDIFGDSSDVDMSRSTSEPIPVATRPRLAGYGLQYAPTAQLPPPRPDIYWTNLFIPSEATPMTGLAFPASEQPQVEARSRTHSSNSDMSMSVDDPGPPLHTLCLFPERPSGIGFTALKRYHDAAHPLTVDSRATSPSTEREDSPERMVESLKRTRERPKKKRRVARSSGSEMTLGAWSEGTDMDI